MAERINIEILRAVWSGGYTRSLPECIHQAYRLGLTNPLVEAAKMARVCADLAMNDYRDRFERKDD